MSYQGYTLPQNQQFPEQAVGFVGLTYPRLKILWNVLIDPQRGLFFCNPVLLLIIPGLVYFWRSGKHAEFFVVLEAILAFVLFNASFGESIVSWGGGTATGPRQVTPAMPFFALALVFLPPIYNYLMAALAGLSTLYMLAAVSTNPHFPYEYDNPVWQFALPHYFRGDFSFNRDTYFGGGDVFGDSVAFNLGKLMGLPGPLQLVPLWLGWTIVATELFEDLQIWRDNMQASSRLDCRLTRDRDSVRSSADGPAAAAPFTAGAAWSARALLHRQHSRRDAAPSHSRRSRISISTMSRSWVRCRLHPQSYGAGS